MADGKDIFTPQGDVNSKIISSDSSHALPEEKREALTDYLLARRLRKYRQMKKLEGGEGWRDMPGVARDYHSSSPGDGMKVEETAGAYVVAFEGDAGPEVAFVERESPGAGDAEFEDFGGVPVC